MTTTPTAWLDDVGNTIRIGDVVVVSAVHPDRGAILGITSTPSRVVGFGRTRVRIDVPSRVGIDTVTPELLHITVPVDGRPLRTWSQYHGTEGAPTIDMTPPELDPDWGTVT